MTPLLTIAKIIRTSLSNGDTLRVTFRKKDGTENNIICCNKQRCREKKSKYYVKKR